MWRLRFCRCVEISRGGGSTPQPKCTEPDHCSSGQPWAWHGALQGQIQPLKKCAALVVKPAMGGPAAGPGRWFVGVAVLLVGGASQRRRQHSATIVHRALPVCECSALGMLWGTARSNAASAVCSRSGGAGTAGGGRTGRGGGGGGGWAVSGECVGRGGRRATTAQRALPVCEWPAAGMPWGTARSNAVSAVCSRCEGA